MKSQSYEGDANLSEQYDAAVIIHKGFGIWIQCREYDFHPSRRLGGNVRQ